MSAIASQITSLTIVYSTVYSGAYQRKHQSSASLTFVRRIHRSPGNSPHKWHVTRKMIPFDDVIVDIAFTFKSYLFDTWYFLTWPLWHLHIECEHLLSADYYHCVMNLILVYFVLPGNISTMCIHWHDAIMAWISFASLVHHTRNLPVSNAALWGFSRWPTKFAVVWDLLTLT